jgi:hypothetical protein
MKFALVFTWVLLLAGPLLGQLTVPDVVAPYEPIVIGCNCIVPENGEASFIWSVDSKSKFRGVPEEAPVRIHVWAPPGAHSAEAVVIVKTFQEFTILIADPADSSKTITKKVKLPVNFDIQRYSKSYVVGTPGPGPAPGPDPPPDPSPGPGPGPPPPADPFAAEVRKWLKAVPPSSYSIVGAMAIADNYQAVASEAVATQANFDILAFSAKTKEKNHATLSVTGVQPWVEPFFRPLAQYQSKLAEQRGIDIYKDEAGLARIWSETAKAIKEGAF